MTAESASGRLRRRLGRALGSGTDTPPRPVLPAALVELARTGPAPLTARHPASAAPLRVATVIPSFRRGSGGHATIVHLLRHLSHRGHAVSLWLEDFELLHAGTAAANVRRNFAEFFGAAEIALHTDFADWTGADVVLATGWQTVPRALLLPDAASRAYLVQDHEPAFYAASAEALCAADTYRQGLHCIAASRWLAELLRTRYGASASHFDLAVDHSVYGLGDGSRRDDLVVFYARAATPRRAVPLGLLALEELKRRRPAVGIALFGGDRSAEAGFPHTDLGVLSPAELAALYRRATAGMVFSLTNPSLTGLEMMACGLPCVELATEPMLATFGGAGPLKLADPDPLALCLALEQLLDDPHERRRRADSGLEMMRGRHWEAAAVQVEEGLRVAVQGGRSG